MRLGYLASAAGLEFDGAGVDEEALAAQLREEATMFLRGGGHVSLAEWGALSHLERQALAGAGERIDEEQAALIGIATQGPMQAAAIAQDLDAGDVAIRVGLSTAVGQVAKRMQQREVPRE